MSAWPSVAGTSRKWTAFTEKAEGATARTYFVSPAASGSSSRPSAAAFPVASYRPAGRST
jgi:hypothetical protein